MKSDEGGRAGLCIGGQRGSFLCNEAEGGEKGRVGEFLGAESLTRATTWCQPAHQGFLWLES